MWLSLAITVIACYLLGNLNGAILASRLYAQEDIRNRGSGNAGLTNFVRNFGVGKGLLVIFLDVGKAVAACLLGGGLLAPYGMARAGAVAGALAVSVGHDFPALWGFRGGKGILCGATIALMLDWRCFLILAAIFFLTFFLTRYVSLSSILAATAFSVCFGYVYRDDLILQICVILIGVMAVGMHHSNIRRLLNGTESKFSLGSKGKQL